MSKNMTVEATAVVDTPTAQRHGVCPVCEGYGGNDVEQPDDHDCGPQEGRCCVCPGCHDGWDGPPESDDFDPMGSWEAYQVVRGES